jgi:multidrug efflux pump subunit AcrA (membrane-fusion protein)
LTVKKLLFAIVLASAAGAGLYYWQFAPRNQALTESQLTFAPLQQITIRDIISATGLIEPRDVVLVGSEMPGVAQVVLGKINQIVPEGTTLVQLDDRKLRLKCEEGDNAVRTARAALAQAEASRDAAEIALRTQVEIASRGGFRSDKEQAEAQFKAAGAGVLAAQANLEVANTARKEAQLALDMAFIKVPVLNSMGPKREYLILERKVHEGQMVGPQGQPLFVLADGLERMEVHAQVAEGDVNKVRPGQVALFNITTYADEEAEVRGVVKEIRPQAANVKGAVFYDTVIEVANQKDAQSGEWRLRPGMTVSVDILRREHKDVWRVPATALNFQLEDAYQSEAAKARIAEWRERRDFADWNTVWTWDAAKRSPWPLFVRINGLKNGEPGLKDSEGNEVLEWEPGREPASRSTQLRVIIAAPPAHTPGFFDKPANIKVS